MISTVAPPIPFHVPDEPDIEGFVEDARAILASGRLSLGPYTERLEAALGPWVGPGTVIAVSNCSDGLIAALWAVREPGAEVIVPGFTYLATWQAVVWAGMTPVVADVDERGLLDPAAAAAAISPGLAPSLGSTWPASRPTWAACEPSPTRMGSPSCSTARTRSGRAGSIGRSAPAATSRSSASARPSSSVSVRVGSSSSTTRRATDAVRRFATQGHHLGELDALGTGMNLRMPELTAAMALRALP